MEEQVLDMAAFGARPSDEVGLGVDVRALEGDGVRLELLVQRPERGGDALRHATCHQARDTTHITEQHS